MFVISYLQVEGHVNMIGKSSMVEGVAHTLCTRGTPLLFATKEEKSESQANGRDEGWFSCVGLRCAEAAAFGVLPRVENSLHNATTSY